MNKLIIRFGTGIATAAAFAAMATPSFALTINNGANGAFSTSFVNVLKVKTTAVSQTNTTAVATNTNVVNNTGGNASNFNTGGTNGIVTGPATTGVTVGVTGNTNTAVNGCGCVPAAPAVINNGANGAFSNSGVNLTWMDTTMLGQTNATSVSTNTNVVNNTGNNSSSFNTGGANGIMTGGTSTGVGVTVGGSSNVAAL